jgi:acyl carrier protein
MKFESFCHFIAAYTHTPLKDIEENASFRDDLGIDSLQMVNLVVGLMMEMKVGMDSLTGSNDLSTVGKLYHAFLKDVEK